MIDFSRAMTNRTLWLLDAGDRVHLAMEPTRGVDPRKNGYLVLPIDTSLVVENVQGGIAENIVCRIGLHTVMLDPMWMAYEVDIDVDSQDLTADIVTLENALIECAVGAENGNVDEWPSDVPIIRTCDIIFSPDERS